MKEIKNGRLAMVSMFGFFIQVGARAGLGAGVLVGCSGLDVRRSRGRQRGGPSLWLPGCTRAHRRLFHEPGAAPPQAIVTGKGPVENLNDHLANPDAANFYR